MLVSALNVIAVLVNPEVCDELKPADINMIMHYIWASPSMKTSEMWTPICVPGISEEFLLHMYTNFYNNNLGLIFISDESSGEVFESYSSLANEIF